MIQQTGPNTNEYRAERGVRILRVDREFADWLMALKASVAKLRARNVVLSRPWERAARREPQLIRERLEGWALEAAEDLQAERPQMPQGDEDRAADIGEPLLAIADLAGGPGPAEARSAAVEITAAVQKVEPSLGDRLLADIRTVYESADVERLCSH